MKINDSIDMKGRLTLRLHDRRGRLVDEIAANNDIVMSGREMVAKLFANVAIDPISHIAVGTGITPVNPDSDAQLETEVFRKAIKPVDPTTDLIPTAGRLRVMLSAELDFAEGNAALTEAGMFNSDLGGSNVMYNRVTFPPVNKTADFKLTLVWEVQF